MKAIQILSIALAASLSAPISAQEIRGPSENEIKEVFSMFGLSVGSFKGFEQQIIYRELADCMALKEQNAEAWWKYVDNDGVSVDSSGLRSVGEIASYVFGGDYRMVSSKVTDLSVKLLTDQVAILTYKARNVERINGTEGQASTINTTVYSKESGEWLAVYHHSTELEADAKSD